jgi:hypothetical protein
MEVKPLTFILGLGFMVTVILGKAAEPEKLSSSENTNISRPLNVTKDKGGSNGDKGVLRGGHGGGGATDVIDVGHSLKDSSLIMPSVAVFCGAIVWLAFEELCWEVIAIRCRPRVEPF